MKVLLSAAEASSDAHGAELLKQLRAQCPAGEEFRAFGVGGPKLREAGLESVVDARELLSMGFLEVLGRLPRILRALDTVVRTSERERPDVAVVIDYPDFHFRLAARLKAQGIPVIYYIPPKVWAWRKGRIEKLRTLFSKILCVFPFEREFFAKAGLAIRYVGNPLLDELPLQVERAEARRRLGLAESDQVLALLAGSRPSELKYHLEVVLESAVRTVAKLRAQGAMGATEPMRVLLPLPVTAPLDSIRARIQAWMVGGGWDRGEVIDVRVSQGDSAMALIAADAALVKSGTSTLEAAILGCPHAVLYKASTLTWWIFKYLIRYRGPIALTNLVAGKKPGDRYVAEELIGPYATAELLSDQVVSLFTDQDRRQWVQREFEAIRRRLAVEGGASPSAQAAREVLALVRP